MAKAKSKKSVPKAKVAKSSAKKITAAKKSADKKAATAKRAADKKVAAAKKKEESKTLSSKEEVQSALDGRKKLVLQKRNKDSIVYVRMKPDMFDRFEEAYAKHCTDNLLNPASYGMSTFVRENAYANLKASRKI